jgi:arylsulfatase A-like enzyme
MRPGPPHHIVFTNMRKSTPSSLKFRFAIFLVSLTTIVAGLLRGAEAAGARSTLLIVIDGLRPDYITRELMPNLHGLEEAGVVAENHHSVFPTVTRVNSSSIATGAYPRTHGLMQNTIYLPDVSPNPIDTAEAEALLKAESATGGKLLTAVSLGELLTQAGKKVLVVGSGSTGASLLLNHKKFAEGGLLNSRGFVRPEPLQVRASDVLGAFPTAAYPYRTGNRWAMDAYLEIGLKEVRPDLTLMWITDPDGTAHQHGPGAPETNQALHFVDEEIGRLLSTLSQRGLRDRVNVIVTTDHGFSTPRGPFNLNALLTARGLADGVRVIGGGQIYVQKGGDEKIGAIVRVLQANEWAGAIFTRAVAPGSHKGFIPGTLSFDAIEYQHPRAADILVDANWTHGVNKHGYPGITTSGGHGSSSPYDIRIRMIASGPDFKRGSKSRVPSGNIDIAPTLCHLFGLKPAPSMSGRVLTELLRDGPGGDSIPANRIVHRATTEWEGGRYEVELHKVRVGTTDYVEFTQTKR